MKFSNGSSPMVPVSWGELVDKITILEIKSIQLKTASGLANVRSELAMLVDVLATLEPIPEAFNALKVELAQVNEAIWKVEDDIRLKEKGQSFDGDFIQLARSVYFLNDRRAQIKRSINELLQSGLVEEKGYAQYS